MIETDLQLDVSLPILGVPFDVGAAAFVDWLTQLRKVPTFAVEWTAQWAEGGPSTNLRSDTARYLEEFAAFNADKDGFLSIWANEAGKPRLFDAELEWSTRRQAIAELTFFRADPAHGIGPMQYIEMIKVTTAWMRPQHLRFGPSVYQRLDHPLDLHRRGIGWIGWVPFALTAADVPEAVLVQQVNGGTIIMTWPDFWQAHPGVRNDDAVRRTQDVEVRLNLLGVLPTTQDLAGGNWGR
jgi:Immunity protein 52